MIYSIRFITPASISARKVIVDKISVDEMSELRVTTRRAITGELSHTHRASSRDSHPGQMPNSQLNIRKVIRKLLRLKTCTKMTINSWLQPALADNLSALPPEVILWCLMLARPLNSTGPSRLWVPPLGTVSHLNSTLFRGTSPVRFTSSLKLLFLPGPGLRAPLSSYLEVALYKFHR